MKSKQPHSPDNNHHFHGNANHDSQDYHHAYRRLAIQAAWPDSSALGPTVKGGWAIWDQRSKINDFFFQNHQLSKEKYATAIIRLLAGSICSFQPKTSAFAIGVSIVALVLIVVVIVVSFFIYHYFFIFLILKISKINMFKMISIVMKKKPEDKSGFSIEEKKKREELHDEISVSKKYKRIDNKYQFLQKGRFSK